MVFLDNPVEEDEAEYRPYDHKSIGFRFDGVIGKRTRKQQEHQEGDHDGYADTAQYAVLLAAFLPRSFEDGHGSETVENDGTNRCGVNDPANGRPSQKRNGQGNDNRQENRVDWDLLVAQASETLGKDAVLGHGVAQAADGAQHADEAGEHKRKKGGHENVDASIPKVVMGGVEGGQPRDSIELVQAADVVQPAGATLWVSGDAQQKNEDVESRGDDERDGENTEHVGVFEPVLRSGMRYALEADESPGREEGDTHDLSECFLVGHEGRLHRHISVAMADHGSDKANRDPYGEEQRERLHAASCGHLALHAQKRDEADDEQRNEGFSQENLVAEYRVEVSEIEQPMKEIPREQRNARGVCPEYGNVHQEHEPSHQEGAVIAEDEFHIVVQAARPRITICQEMIVVGHHQHHGEPD